MNTRLIEKPGYMLLYTDTCLFTPGPINWYVSGPFSTDTEAVTALLSVNHMEVTLSRVVTVEIPMGVMPATLKEIPGHVVDLEDEEPAPEIVKELPSENQQPPKTRRFAPSAATATPPTEPEDVFDAFDELVGD